MKTGERVATEETLCDETGYESKWSNVMVKGSVCARDRDGAVAAITDEQVTRAARDAAAAMAVALLECAELPCPVGPCSQQSPQVSNLRRREAPYAITDSGESEGCPENQTRWTYRIRIDADVSVSCGCPQPA